MANVVLGGWTTLSYTKSTLRVWLSSVQQGCPASTPCLPCWGAVSLSRHCLANYTNSSGCQGPCTTAAMCCVLLGTRMLLPMPAAFLSLMWLTMQPECSHAATVMHPDAIKQLACRARRCESTMQCRWMEVACLQSCQLRLHWCVPDSKPPGLDKRSLSAMVIRVMRCS